MQVEVLNRKYKTDDMTNVTPEILSKLERKLHLKQRHPINLIHQRIKHFLYSYYVSPRGNPLFSFHDALHPVSLNILASVGLAPFINYM